MIRESLKLQKRKQERCVYICSCRKCEEFLSLPIKDNWADFFCIRFFAAKCDWKYDRVQAQSATLSPGETTYQFHGCKTVKNPSGWRNANDQYWYGFRGLHDEQNYQRPLEQMVLCIMKVPNSFLVHLTLDVC